MRARAKVNSKAYVNAYAGAKTFADSDAGDYTSINLGSGAGAKAIRRRRRQRTVYACRAVAAVILFIAAVLMVCGCMFIYEHLIYDRFFAGKSEAVGANASAVSGNLAVNDGILTAAENDFSQAAGDDIYYGIDNEISDAYGNGASAVRAANWTEGAYTVILDAGHGGKDVGAQVGDIYEKDITLLLTDILSSKFAERGVNVIYTRASDETVSLDERVNIGNSEDADLFISVHCNSMENNYDTYGLQCFYDTGNDGGSLLAEYISGSVEESGLTMVHNPRYEDFKVTREVNIPSVLVETGYMTNDYELENLLDEAYLDSLAEVIADGAMQWFEEAGYM